MRLRPLLLLLALAAIALPACSDEGADRVLLVGDSVMGQTAPALSRALGDDVDVRNESVSGSGLLTPWFVDWPAELRRLLRVADPDVVAFLFVGNYRGDDEPEYETATGHQIEQPGDPAFYRAWQAQAERMTEMASEEADVIWVLPPPMANATDARIVAGLREVYEAVAEETGADLVDADDSLAGPDNEFVARWRAVDGVHLAPDGARRLGDQLADTVDEHL